MAQVTVTIAGRQYRMACDDGQEAHLESLAARLDAKIADLREHFGEIGDQRITVMAALTIADELSESERHVAELRSEIEIYRRSDTAGEERVAALSDKVAASLGEAARRIERIARGLDSASRE